MEAVHQCGIAAVYIKEDGDSTNKSLFYLYKLLLNQQNRGQLSAGVTTYNTNRQQILDTYKDLGTVNEVFKTSDRQMSMEIFRRYAGNRGIGHTRYATSGSEERSLAQPFERHHGRKWKWFSFCWNGNLANYTELKEQLLEKADYHITHDSDTEIIMHYLARELKGSVRPNLIKVFSRLAQKFDGCFNIAFMNAYGEMIILRDSYGFRPVVYGSKNNMFLVASESNALINCGITNYKNLEPGHLIYISEKGEIKIKRYIEVSRKAHCMFEWVYFANVSSVLDDKSVYITRKNLGTELAKKETEKISEGHVIIPVPDTAKAAGDAFAYELNASSSEGLIRNRYVGRTFIEGSNREDKIQNKYTALREVIEGKKLILIDDSIVRGTTTKQIVRYLKRVGAKEVHLRVSCPPIRGPCFYGIDMSTISELLVPKFENGPMKGEVSGEVIKKIADELGAESLQYQSVGGLIKSIGKPANELCTACITGDYPTKWGQKLYYKAWENYRKGIKERTYAC